MNKLYKLKNTNFTTNGKTWHFGYFTPTNGSTTDVDYIILKEEYK